MNKAVFDLIFHPVAFPLLLLIANVALFATIESQWRASRIHWRKVLPGDALAFLFSSYVVVEAARILNGPIGIRGPWPAPIDELALPIRIALYIVVADFGAYWTHRLVHLPVLWRIHRWHHAPTHMYWFAGSRSSVLQQTLFNLPYIFASPLFDVSPWWTATALSMLYTFTNSWMHMDVTWRLRWLDWIFVTPRTHHIHHSEDPRHYNRNFGVLLSIWDRLFGTFTSPEEVVHSELKYGTGEKVSIVRLGIGL